MLMTTNALAADAPLIIVADHFVCVFSAAAAYECFTHRRPNRFKSATPPKPTARAQ
jgi:hypothetical protein